MNTESLISAICLCLCPSVMMSAQEQASVSRTAALPFLSMEPNTRAMAMGGVHTVAETEAWSHFGNMAAVPFGEDTFEAAVSYGMWQPTAASGHVISAGATYNISNRFGVTFGFLSNIGKSYDVMDATGVATSTFTPNDFRIGAGFAYRITDGLSVGAGLNYAQSTVAPKSEHYKSTLGTFSADIQILYRVLDKINISLSGNNLGIPVKSASGASYPIPMNAKIGVGYEDIFNDRHRIAAAADFGSYFAGSADIFAGAGAEYTYNNLVAVRAGYHYGGRSVIPSYASVGLGFKFFGVHIDATYLIASGAFRNTLSVGVGYSF